MKKLTLISAIILGTNFLYAQWVQLEQFTDNSLKSVFFTDANTGYAAGDNGTIAKTNDGGMTWEVQTVGEDLNIYSLHFPNKSTGYALGRYGFMVGDPCVFLKTVDEGMNWSINVIDSSFSLTDVYFMNEDTGYICGSYHPGGVTTGLILKTTDGGNDWSTMYEGYGFLNSLHFPSSNTGYVMGHSDAATQPFWIMQKTVDNGQTWITSYGPPYSYLQVSSVYFTNENNGYTVGDNTLLRTSDGGTNWISQDIDTSSLSTYLNLNSVFFTDPSTGYIAAGNWSLDEGCVFQTIDGGENWVYEYIGDNPLHSVYFPSMDTGYIVGNLGDIFKTTNGGNPVGIKTKLNESKNFIISPNPISSTSVIEYHLVKPSPVKLQILDVNGQVIRTSVDDLQQQGEQMMTIDGSGLKPGVYFCILKTNNGIQTKKIIKL